MLQIQYVTCVTITVTTLVGQIMTCLSIKSINKYIFMILSEPKWLSTFVMAHVIR